LLSASKPYQTLKMRILLALGTGLRRGDIESLRVCDIDFENSCITARSQKTRKSMGSRPVPVLIMAELKKYISGLDSEQKKYSIVVSVNTDGIRYVRSLDWVISNFTIFARPLAQCLLRTEFPQLSHRNCWNIRHQI
jgi:integrase